MNLIEKVLSQKNDFSANDIIQTLGNIYAEPIERETLSVYPQFIQDIIFIIDLDTELSINGIGGVLENGTGAYISNIIIALNNIKADNEANILQQLYEKYKIDTEDEALYKLTNKLYLYTDFDIWSLLEIYVDKEKRNCSK